MVTYLVAKGNTGDIVKRLEIETIDAAKYLIILRYEFNDYRKDSIREILMRITE